MDWIFLLLAGCAEIAGVICMKYSNGFKNLKFTLLTVLVGATSFYLLSRALQTIDMGTAYGVWTGIGSAGSVVVGMLLFKEPRDRKRLLFITGIIVSVIGLRVTTGH